ncbi:MAG: histidine phosphatase family protein [Clostridia bacterium]|nr:histidine phosphatase family protein [Clostridia bacterium]
MTTLILIRHGESEANRQGFFAGQLDLDLQNKGIKQAQLTAKYISENYKVDKIYSSDLQRAYKTAKCLAEILDLEITSDKGLREINAGKWQGMTFEDLRATYPEEYSIWLNHIGHSVLGGGETVKQLGDRVMGALTKIAEENDGKTVAIATHATPIRVAQCIIQTGDIEEMQNIPWVSNASVTVIEYDNNAWRIVAVSKDEHLAEIKTSVPANV